MYTEKILKQVEKYQQDGNPDRLEAIKVYEHLRTCKYSHRWGKKNVDKCKAKWD